jgi:hypothetical protein
MALRKAAEHALLAGAMQRKKPEQGKERCGEQGAGVQGHHGRVAAGGVRESSELQGRLQES